MKPNGYIGNPTDSQLSNQSFKSYKYSYKNVLL